MSGDREGTPPAASIAALADGEGPGAARVLARAFRDNPLNVAVIGGTPERRLRCNLHGARMLLPVARVHGEVWVARVEGLPAGVLVGTPELAYPLPPPSPAARLRGLLGQGLRVAWRWARVFEALDALHPPQPHWYLGSLAVDPPQQGRGLGGALLRFWLDRAGGAEVYLETDREDNVRFYGRRGFELLRRTQVLGTPIWCMRRPPAAPGLH